MVLLCCHTLFWLKPPIWGCFRIRAPSDEVSSLSSYWSLDSLSSTLNNAHMQALAILLKCLRARSGGCSVSWHSIWKNDSIKPRESWLSLLSRGQLFHGTGWTFWACSSSSTELITWEADGQLMGHILSSSFQARFNLSVHINIKVILPAHRDWLILPWENKEKRNNVSRFQKTWLLRDEEIP